MGSYYNIPEAIFSLLNGGHKESSICAYHCELSGSATTCQLPKEASLQMSILLGFRAEGLGV